MSVLNVTLDIHRLAIRSTASDRMLMGSVTMKVMKCGETGKSTCGVILKSQVA